MTLIISTVGRCNLSICAIDRLIVQVPRILKEPGTFSLFIVLPFQGRFHYLKCSLFMLSDLRLGTVSITFIFVVEFEIVVS